jgi:hypothetical protein
VVALPLCDPPALLLVNGVPHFVQGLSGKRFPTPFSGGAGTEDAPARNVLWGAGISSPAACCYG